MIARTPMTEAMCGRRQAVAGLALAVSVPLLGEKASAADCEYIKAPSGLEYCDLVDGTGPEPVQGALIRQGPHIQSCVDYGQCSCSRPLESKMKNKCIRLSMP